MSYNQPTVRRRQLGLSRRPVQFSQAARVSYGRTENNQIHTRAANTETQTLRVNLGVGVGVESGNTTLRHATSTVSQTRLVTPVEDVDTNLRGHRNVISDVSPEETSLEPKYAGSTLATDSEGPPVDETTRVSLHDVSISDSTETEVCLDKESTRAKPVNNLVESSTCSLDGASNTELCMTKRTASRIEEESGFESPGCGKANNTESVSADESHSYKRNPNETNAAGRVGGDCQRIAQMLSKQKWVKYFVEDGELNHEGCLNIADILAKANNGSYASVAQLSKDLSRMIQSYLQTYTPGSTPGRMIIELQRWAQHLLRTRYNTSLPHALSAEFLQKESESRLLQNKSNDRLCALGHPEALLAERDSTKTHIHVRAEETMVDVQGPSSTENTGLGKGNRKPAKNRKSATHTGNKSTHATTQSTTSSAERTSSVVTSDLSLPGSCIASKLPGNTATECTGSGKRNTNTDCEAEVRTIRGGTAGSKDLAEQPNKDVKGDKLMLCEVQSDGAKVRRSNRVRDRTSASASASSSVTTSRSHTPTPVSTHEVAHSTYSLEGTFTHESKSRVLSEPEIDDSQQVKCIRDTSKQPRSTLKRKSALAASGTSLDGSENGPLIDKVEKLQSRADSKRTKKRGDNPKKRQRLSNGRGTLHAMWAHATPKCDTGDLPSESAVKLDEKTLAVADVGPIGQCTDSAEGGISVVEATSGKLMVDASSVASKPEQTGSPDGDQRGECSDAVLRHDTILRKNTARLVSKIVHARVSPQRVSGGRSEVDAPSGKKNQSTDNGILAKENSITRGNPRECVTRQEAKPKRHEHHRRGRTLKLKRKSNEQIKSPSPNNGLRVQRMVIRQTPPGDGMPGSRPHKLVQSCRPNDSEDDTTPGGTGSIDRIEDRVADTVGSRCSLLTKGIDLSLSGAHTLETPAIEANSAITIGENRLLESTSLAVVEDASDDISDSPSKDKSAQKESGESLREKHSAHGLNDTILSNTSDTTVVEMQPIPRGRLKLTRGPAKTIFSESNYRKEGGECDVKGGVLKGGSFQSIAGLKHDEAATGISRHMEGSERDKDALGETRILKNLKKLEVHKNRKTQKMLRMLESSMSYSPLDPKLTCEKSGGDSTGPFQVDSTASQESARDDSDDLMSPIPLSSLSAARLSNRCIVDDTISHHGAGDIQSPMARSMRKRSSLRRPIQSCTVEPDKQCSSVTMNEAQSEHTPTPIETGPRTSSTGGKNEGETPDYLSFDSPELSLRAKGLTAKPICMVSGKVAHKCIDSMIGKCCRAVSREICATFGTDTTELATTDPESRVCSKQALNTDSDKLANDDVGDVSDGVSEHAVTSRVVKNKLELSQQIPNEETHKAAPIVFDDPPGSEPNSYCEPSIVENVAEAITTANIDIDPGDETCAGDESTGKQHKVKNGALKPKVILRTSSRLSKARGIRSEATGTTGVEANQQEPKDIMREIATGRKGSSVAGKRVSQLDDISRSYGSCDDSLNLSVESDEVAKCITSHRPIEIKEPVSECPKSKSAVGVDFVNNIQGRAAENTTTQHGCGVIKAGSVSVSTCEKLPTDARGCGDSNTHIGLNTAPGDTSRATQKSVRLKASRAGSKRLACWSGLPTGRVKQSKLCFVKVVPSRSTHIIIDSDAMLPQKLSSQPAVPSVKTEFYPEKHTGAISPVPMSVTASVTTSQNTAIASQQIPRKSIPSVAETSMCYSQQMETSAQSADVSVLPEASRTPTASPSRIARPRRNLMGRSLKRKLVSTNLNSNNDVNNIEPSALNPGITTGTPSPTLPSEQQLPTPTDEVASARPTSATTPKKTGLSAESEGSTRKMLVPSGNQVHATKNFAVSRARPVLSPASLSRVLLAKLSDSAHVANYDTKDGAPITSKILLKQPTVRDDSNETSEKELNAGIDGDSTCTSPAGTDNQRSAMGEIVRNLSQICDNPKMKTQTIQPKNVGSALTALFACKAPARLSVADGLVEANRKAAGKSALTLITAASTVELGHALDTNPPSNPPARASRACTDSVQNAQSALYSVVDKPDVQSMKVVQRRFPVRKSRRNCSSGDPSSVAGGLDHFRSVNPMPVTENEKLSTAKLGSIMTTGMLPAPSAIYNDSSKNSSLVTTAKIRKPTASTKLKEGDGAPVHVLQDSVSLALQSEPQTAKATCADSDLGPNDDVKPPMIPNMNAGLATCKINTKTKNVCGKGKTRKKVGHRKKALSGMPNAAQDVSGNQRVVNSTSPVGTSGECKTNDSNRISTERSDVVPIGHAGNLVVIPAISTFEAENVLSPLKSAIKTSQILAAQSPLSASVVDSVGSACASGEALPITHSGDSDSLVDVKDKDSATVLFLCDDDDVDEPLLPSTPAQKRDRRRRRNEQLRLCKEREIKERRENSRRRRAEAGMSDQPTPTKDENRKGITWRRERDTYYIYDTGVFDSVYDPNEHNHDVEHNKINK